MTIRSLQGKTPDIADSAFVDETALVIGDVTIGEDSSIWPMTVVRGDVQKITIGKRTNIQDACVCHVTHDCEYTPGGFPLTIGDGVTAGHRATLHACTIGNYCLIGMSATIMDGAVLGDKLIIGLNSDGSVKRLGKGDGRPYNFEENRAYLLAAFGFVDAVVVFDEDTPIELIRLIKPDVLVKGGDYDALALKGDKQYIVGSDIVKSYQGVVEVIPFLKGFSTTSLVEKIKKSI